MGFLKKEEQASIPVESSGEEIQKNLGSNFLRELFCIFWKRVICPFFLCGVQSTKVFTATFVGMLYQPWRQHSTPTFRKISQFLRCFGLFWDAKKSVAKKGLPAFAKFRRSRIFLCSKKGSRYSRNFAVSGYFCVPKTAVVRIVVLQSSENQRQDLYFCHKRRI